MIKVSLVNEIFRVDVKGRSYFLLWVLNVKIVDKEKIICKEYGLNWNYLSV